MARVNKGNLALGAGYAVVLSLLVCSTVEAYRLQQTISRRETTVYQAHIVRENALSGLRDEMWLGATVAREFLISGDTGRFRAQIIQITQKGNERAAVLRYLIHLGEPGEAADRRIRTGNLVRLLGRQVDLDGRVDAVRLE